MKKNTSTAMAWLACGLASTLCFNIATAQDAPPPPPPADPHAEAALPPPPPPADGHAEAPLPHPRAERDKEHRDKDLSHPGEPRPNAPRDGEREENIFSMADGDHNGKVTFDEFKAASEQRLRRMYNLADENKDGAITQEEAQAARKRMEAMHDSTPPGASRREEGGQKDRPQPDRDNRKEGRGEGMRAEEMARRLQERMQKQGLARPGQELRDSMEDMRQRLDELKQEMDKRLDQQEKALRNQFQERAKERKRDKKDRETESGKNNGREEE